MSVRRERRRATGTGVRSAGEVCRALSVTPADGPSAINEVGSVGRRRFGPNRLDGDGAAVPADAAGPVPDFGQLRASAVLRGGILGEPQDPLAIAAILTLNATLGSRRSTVPKRADARALLGAPCATVVRDSGIAINGAGRISRETSSRSMRATPCRRTSASSTVDLRADSRRSPASHSRSKHSTRSSVAIALADRTNLAFPERRSYGRRAAWSWRDRHARPSWPRGASARSPRGGGRADAARLAGWRRLALAVIALCAVLFVVGLRGEEAVLMFLTAVRLAVAAFPRAAAVVTVALALRPRWCARTR